MSFTDQLPFCFPNHCYTREHQSLQTYGKIMRIKGSSNITSKAKHYNNNMANNEWWRHTRSSSIILPNWSYMYIHIYKYKRIAHMQQNSRWTIWWCVTMDCWIDKQNFYMMMMMMAMRMCRSVTYAINNQNTQQTEESEESSVIFLRKRRGKSNVFIIE